MKAVIHSKKHTVQISQSTVAQGLVVNTVICLAAEAPSTTPTGIIEGANVKAIWVEYWVGNASATVVGSYTLIMYKDPSNNSGCTTAQMAALHDYDNKKNILFTSQALTPPTDGGLIKVMGKWYPIPKSKQRFGLEDSIKICIRNNNSTAVDVNFCGVAIFKEYT